MPNPHTTFTHELAAFRVWAHSKNPKPDSGEWECDYDRYHDLMTAAAAFALSIPFSHLTPIDIDDLLYTIARDNECEIIVEAITDKQPSLILDLANASITTNAEWNAKWQLATALDQFPLEQAEPLLIRFANDAHEYVRRRAISALAQLRSSHAEPIAIALWDAPADGMEQYAKMTILSALDTLNSPRLEEFLTLALQRDDHYLRQLASEIIQRRSP